MTIDRTYTATVALWRQDSNVSDLYNIVDGSVTVLQSQRVQTLANIYCTQEYLDRDNHVEIRRGDIVGVLIPTNLAIRMIGLNGDYNIRRNSVQQLTPSDQLSGLMEQQLRIHLYADTGKKLLHYKI